MELVHRYYHDLYFESAAMILALITVGKYLETRSKGKTSEAITKLLDLAPKTAHNIQCVVMDKTGTITQGKPVVTNVETNMALDKFLAVAAGLEMGSEHPLAEAIMEFTGKQQAQPAKVEDFRSIPGKGVEGRIGGRMYYAGNQRLMEEKQIPLGYYEKRLDKLADEGKTPMLFAEEKEILGIISVADVVKPTSHAAVKEIKAMGIEVVMLTGDNRRTAKAIRRQLDIDKVIAEVLPQDKEREIAALQQEGKTVAMIGDGINDAPALARADVGLAIGAGTDVAIESADVVLMKNDLLDVVTAIRLSKAVIRNIKQNLFWAFFYNTLGIPVAVGVFYTTFGLKLNPMIGAAAMSLSSVFVVTNALRLRRFKASAAAETAQDVTVLPEAEITVREDGQADIDRAQDTRPADDNHQKDDTLTQENQSASNKNHKEDNIMLTMKIEGMACGHCKAAVEKALNAIDGVKAEVNLEAKTASVDALADMDKEVLRKAVEDAGYEVVGIE